MTIPKFIKVRTNSSDKTSLVEEAKSLDISPTQEAFNRSSQLKELASQFIKNRLENSNTIETTKKLAIDRLALSISTIESPRMLLQIIQTLDEQTSKDLMIMSESGKSSEKSSGSLGVFNLFMGGSTSSSDNTDPSDKSTSLSREAVALMDTILEITEVLTHNKEQSPKDYLDNEE